MNGDPEVEKAVLGAALLEYRGLSAMLRILSAESFHDSRHVAIAAAIKSLHVKGSSVDILTVTQELARRDLLKDIGGASYIGSLTNTISSSANAEHHCRIVAEQHAMRSLSRTALDISQDAMHASDPFDALQKAQASISGIFDRLTSGIDNSANAADRLGDLLDTSPRQPGYSTGVYALDRVMPVEAGLPYIVAGRPGIGKSVMSCVTAWHHTLYGESLLFSPEMTLRQIQARILAMESGVPYSLILARRMDQQQYADVEACAARIASRLQLLTVDETPGITPEQVHARASRFRKETGAPGFVLDHLHKMSTGDRRIDKDETPRVSQCMEGLTRVCKDTGMFGIIMCQLNRQVESRPDRRPRLADLKQTGRIEEDAAGVVLLYREGYYQPTQPWEDTLELAVAKNRDGACDVVTCKCVPALSRIS